MQNIAIDKAGIRKKIFSQTAPQIIKNRDLISLIKKGSCHMTADIAGTPNNQNSHKK